MTLDQLLGKKIVLTPVPSCEVTGLQYDSRKIQPGEVFFAFPGEHVDGHQFIPQALQTGAAAVVSERKPPSEFKRSWVQVRHGRQALAEAALKFYGRPDRNLLLTGVTGTNGKTTTVYLVDSILQAAGFTTGRFGTIEHRIGSRSIPAINTTPESLDLVRYLAELNEEGGSHAVFEVSSHALELRRIHGMDFHTVVFTNLSRDHLDFHKTMSRYARAKRRLFQGAGGATPRFAVINRGDRVGRKLLKSTKAETITYGLGDKVDVTAKKIRVRSDGIRFRAKTSKGKLEVKSKLSGPFNVLNILAAIATALTYDIDLEVAGQAIADSAAIPGRFEKVDEGQPFLIIVDYAHTDDALQNLIKGARKLLPKNNRRGRVITLFGCGGDRDRTKRPVMGEIAGRLSDLVILTSDNPRSEDPLNIINDILVGLRRTDAGFSTEPDRAQAIRKALGEAQRGDIVLLAGKGHETYQTMGGVSRPFDDREVARGVLRELGYGAKRSVK